MVVLLLFGAKKLPQLGKAVGSSINNFKEGLKEGQKIEDKTDSDDKPEGSV